MYIYISLSQPLYCYYTQEWFLLIDLLIYVDNWYASRTSVPRQHSEDETCIWKGLALAVGHRTSRENHVLGCKLGPRVVWYHGSGPLDQGFPRMGQFWTWTLPFLGTQFWPVPVWCDEMLMDTSQHIQTAVLTFVLKFLKYPQVVLQKLWWNKTGRLLSAARLHGSGESNCWDQVAVPWSWCSWTSQQAISGSMFNHQPTSLINLNL